MKHYLPLMIVGHVHPKQPTTTQPSAAMNATNCTAAKLLDILLIENCEQIIYVIA